MTHLAVDVPARTRAPWHLWIVGVLGTLWYASGLYAFVMARHGSLSMPPDEADYYATMAAWEVLAWYAGTIGGMAGAALVCLRSRFSVWLFAASLLAVVLSHAYALATGQSRALADQGALAVSLVVLVIAIALLAYARGMRRRGVL